MSPKPLSGAVEALAIRWPARFHPDRAPVHMRNDLFIPAPAPVIWAWLVREPLWPTWYANSQADWIRDHSRDLGPGVHFHWKTFGVSIDSCVREFEPCERIAWDGTGFGVQVYHAWLIVPERGGCRVQTEESQYGWGARLMNLLQPQRMYDGHELWLKSLAIQAARGMPPPL